MEGDADSLRVFPWDWDGMGRVSFVVDLSMEWAMDVEGSGLGLGLNCFSEVGWRDIPGRIREERRFVLLISVAPASVGC